MLKKILLVISTFAVAVLVFALYVWQDKTPQRVSTPAPIASMPASMPAAEKVAKLNIQGVEVPPGKKPSVKVFDARGREKIRFRSEEWRPISETEWHMTRLEARLMLPGTQLIYVTADEGQIVVARGDSDNYDPKRGWLKGRVHMIVDQTDERWREEHPDLSTPDKHPEYAVHLWLDDVRFDLDVSRLESNSSLRGESRDVTIEGTGLRLAWNEVDRRIDLLEILKGKRIELRRNTEFVDFAMPGSEPNRRAKKPAKADATSKPAAEKPGEAAADAGKSPATAPSRTLGEEIFLDMTKEKQLRRKPQQGETYQAKFENGVQITQRRGEQVIGELSANLLEILFDFGEKQREAAEYSPRRATTTSAPAEAAAKAPATQPAAREAADQGRIEVVWTGKLTMTPALSEKRDQTGERLHAVATGNVKVTRGDAGAECEKLVFRNESEQAELYGSPARMHESKTRSMEGDKVFYDRRGGLARVEGRGQMIDTRGLGQTFGLATAEKKSDALADMGAEPVVAKWTEGVELRFGSVPQTKTDPATGETVTSQKESLRNARFRGNVDMSRGSQAMQADDVELVFAEPPAVAPPEKGANASTGAAAGADTKPGKSQNVQLDKMVARGKVRFRNISERAKADQGAVSADELVVTMGVDADGKATPIRADAKGNVAAQQEDRIIRAKDRLAVKFAPIPAPLPPVDRVMGAQVARSRGIDPATVNWDAVDAKRAANHAVEIVYLEAFGDVEAHDPSEPLELAADELLCWMPEGRQKFERAVLTGSPQREAEVEQRGYYVRGPKITINAKTQYAEVPSSGLLRFMSKEDLDGRRLEQPVPVTVSWSKNMVMDGSHNTGVFTGDVHAVSRNTVLDCQQLDLTFEDLPAATTQPTTAPTTQYWVFGPMLDRASKIRSKDRGETSDLGMRKRPALLIAKNEARVTTTTTDPADAARILSRMHIDGPELTVDLVGSQLTVNGAGNLLVEDYRMPVDREKRKARPIVQGSRNPFGASLDVDGPSRTAFRWQNALSFFAQRNLAVLDRDVLMVHLSGSELNLSPQEAAAMKIDVERLQTAKGRRASLRADNLVVQFLRDPSQSRRTNDPTPMAGATELSYLCATGAARLEEGSRSVQGEVITFNRAANTIHVTRSVDAPAKFVDLDERTGTYNVASGDSLSYNVETGQLEGKGFTASATGR